MKGKRTSKYKNIIGEEKSYKFTNVNLVSEVTEGKLITCNGSFIAASWNSTPGSVAILDTAFPSNVKYNTPLIKGHKRSVFDLEFSPFKDNILATASDDATVKLWEIPLAGLKQNLSQDLLTYKGHTRRAAFVKFNPVASDVIASASSDYSLHIWNITKGETYSKGEFSDLPTSLDWNSIGTLVAVTSKKKKIYVFDPRANKAVLDTQIYESPRSPKFTWVGDNEFVTTGFSKSNVKELKLWDIRKVTPELKSEGPVQKLVIDNLLTITTPFYDHESKLLFTSGKGELSIHVYDFNDSTINQNMDYKSQTPAVSVHMFERKVLDYNKCEIDRFIHYNNKKEISFISFKVSRKNPEYEPDLYPPVSSGEPALSYEQWVAGENKEPVKKEIHLLENKYATKPDKIDINEATNKEEKTEEKNDNVLQEKIKIIEEKVNKKQAIYDKLMKEKEDLDNKLKKIREKREEVNDRLNAALKQKALKDKEKEGNLIKNDEEKEIVKENEEEKGNIEIEKENEQEKESIEAKEENEEEKGNNEIKKENEEEKENIEIKKENEEEKESIEAKKENEEEKENIEIKKENEEEKEKESIEDKKENEGEKENIEIKKENEEDNGEAKKENEQEKESIEAKKENEEEKENLEEKKEKEEEKESIEIKKEENNDESQE